MTGQLLHVAEALSRPLLFHPAKLEMILSALGDRLGLSLEVERPDPEASRFLGRSESGRSYRSQDGIAFIPIVGSLANRGAYIGASSGVVSYEGIGAQIRQAAADADVHSIVLDINSGGGEATGMFRLASLIRQARDAKRIVAYIDDVAASAAYGTASAAHEIVVSPTSIVGSIGVVLAHVDRSQELAAKGQRVTLIHAGANKVDGHPFGPLSDQVRADLQAEVLAFYDQFVASVAAGRPKLSDAAIRGTEARTFIGEAGIAAGLADRVASIDEVVDDLKRRNALRPRNSTGGLRMEKTHTQADVDAARAEGAAAGRTEGATAERNRISGILQSEEAKKRPGAALEMALDENAFPVASATKVLGKLPEEAAPAASAGKTDPAADLEARTRESALGFQPAKTPGAEAQGKQEARMSGLMAAADALIARTN